jgi:hypothetical protein
MSEPRLKPRRLPFRTGGEHLPKSGFSTLFKLKQLLEDHLDEIASLVTQRTARLSPRLEQKCDAQSRT